MKKGLFIVLQIALWIMFCMIPILFAPPFMAGHRHPALESPLNFVFIFFIKNIKFILLFYIHYLILIPKFFVTKKYNIYFGLLILLFALVITFPMLTEGLISYIRHEGGPPFGASFGEGHPNMHRHHHGPWPDGHRPPRFIGGENGIHFFMSMIVTLIPLFLTVYRKWLKAQNEKTEMELAFLKSQINHHFLFNSLNSIYVLSLQNNPKASPSIHSLSFIMRYILDESVKEKTKLGKELEYLHHYIELQRLRLNAKVMLKFSVTGESNELEISPMILIPFIENCFKHGLSTVGNCEICISITITGNQLHLYTKNEIFESHPSTNIGIGTKNVVKRLDFDYPNKYELDAKREGENYIVNLNLTLI